MNTQDQNRQQWRSLFSIERVVTILTPLVFAPAAVLVAGWSARNGLRHVDPTAVIALEGAVFTSTVGIAAKWLHGRQNPALLAIEHDAQVASGYVSPGAVGLQAMPVTQEWTPPPPSAVNVPPAPLPPSGAEFGTPLDAPAPADAPAVSTPTA